MYDKQPLQQALIESLGKLSVKSPYRKRINNVIKDLKKENTHIPNSDYNNVIEFVLVMMNSMPGVLERNPNDTQLKNLCMHCIRQLNATRELASKRSR